MNNVHRYLEETVLTIFFWVGVWGTISLVVEHMTNSWISKLLFYIVLVSISFTLLHMREHIPKYN